AHWAGKHPSPHAEADGAFTTPQAGEDEGDGNLVDDGGARVAHGLAPRARWGLHLGVSPASKGWEVLDLTDNCIITTVDAIFYETMSLETWKAEHGAASAQSHGSSPTNSSPAATLFLSTEEDDQPDAPPPPQHFQRLYAHCSRWHAVGSRATYHGRFSSIAHRQLS
ncbi:unnamed protein product, partial [Closterium sp. NIES-53]